MDRLDIPQNFLGTIFSLVAVNFQPMCESQYLHWQIVQAYLHCFYKVFSMKFYLKNQSKTYIPWKPAIFC